MTSRISVDRKVNGCPATEQFTVAAYSGFTTATEAGYLIPLKEYSITSFLAIGVLPSERGKEVSSKLIRPFLGKANSEKAIVYTNTVTRSNVAFYEHFGFQCVEESAIMGTGTTVWALRRSSSNGGAG